MLQILKNKNYYTVLSGFISLFVGIVVLIGWYLHIPFLKSVLPGMVSMKANTALSFVFLGLSIIFLHLNKKPVIYFFGTCTAVIGLLTTLEYIGGLNFGIDELLIKEDINAISTVFPNRMAIMAAINFLLLGIGTILKTKYKKISDFISLFIFANSFLAVMGYLFEIEEFFNIGGTQITPMALHTGLLFMITSLGVIYKYIEDGYFKILTSTATSHIFFKKIIIIILISFPIIGFITIQGKLLNYYDWPIAFGINQISTSIISVIFIYYFANLLYQEQILKEKNQGEIFTQQKKHLEEMKKIQKKLEEKTSSMEKMNKLMIGRELMMVELKKQITSLKETQSK